MKEKIQIVQGNICDAEVDCIICQANTELEMEDEITKKLIDIGGDEIHLQCNSYSSVQRGTAIITGAGNLKAKHIIHAVINDLNEDTEEDQIMQAVRSALTLAKEREITSIALPLIGESSGIPIRRTAELILTEVKKHYESDSTIEKILFIVESDIAYQSIEEGVKQL